MDNVTWKRSLRARRLRLLALMAVILLIVLASTLGALYYFFFFLRSPEYALREAQAAWAKGDQEKFLRYVNVELLTSRGYDDLTADLFAYDASLTPYNQLTFQKFYVQIKPELVESTEELLLRRLTSGEWQRPDALSLLKGRSLGLDYERLLERSQVRNTCFLGLEAVREGEEGTEAVVRVQDEYTGTEFSLVLAMERAADSRYQVAYIKNYREYLDTVAPVQNEGIASYAEATKGIISRYNERLSMQEARFESLTSTKDGELTSSRREALTSLIKGETVPLLKERQEELGAVEVPAGAQYLAAQRALTTRLALAAWESFLKGLETDNPDDFAAAEALHKEAMAVNLRVEEIIAHKALNKNIPNIP